MRTRILSELKGGNHDGHQDRTVEPAYEEGTVQGAAEPMEDDRSCYWPSRVLLSHRNCCVSQNNFLFSMRPGSAAAEMSSGLSYSSASFQ